MSIFKKYFHPIALMSTLMMSILISGCSSNGESSIPVSSTSSSTIISTYSLAGATGVIDEATKTIAVTLPNGTDVTALVATYSTAGASVKVGTTLQTSGVTLNNFTAPVAYIVTAGDGSIETYTVTVTVASSTDKSMTTYIVAGVAGVIDEATKTIAVTVPNETNLAALIATFNSTGNSVKVETTDQTSGVTSNNFTSPVVYTVTSGDGSIATYTVTVAVAESSAKAITAYSFAGYTGALGVVNETAKTIAVTVPNGTNVAALVATFTTTGNNVKVGTATQISTASINNFTHSVLYKVSASDGSIATYTVTVTVAASSAKAMSTYSFAGYTGALGVVNETAKTIAVTVPNGTNVAALVATFTTTGNNVKVGTATQISTASVNNFTHPVLYKVSASDGSIATYTVTVTVAASSAKAITSYSFAGYTGALGVINETAKTITVTIPSGTNVAALVATFTTTGNNVKVGTATQISTATLNNFTNPVLYRVSASDGSITTYTVTVAVATSSAKAIRTYSFAGYTGALGVIDETAKTIAVTVPNGTNVTALVATYSTTGNYVKVGTVTQISTATLNNFTNPVLYKVTAGDGSLATYTVTVAVAASSAKAMSTYSFAGQPDSVGVISESLKTIALSVLPGTDKTARTATFTTTGTNVKVGSVVQTSGATSNDFTNTVIYTVIAADSSTTLYNVTVTEGAGPIPINLGTAGNFAILSKSGVSTTAGSAIVGDMGVSPAATSYITGFGTLTAGATYASSPLVTGKIYAADMVPPTPTYMTTAISDMEIAYNDAAGRAAGVGVGNLNLGAGTLSGQTLVPGTYTWSGNVTITTDLTLNGGVNDVWIFQIANTLDLNSNKIILTGGAQAKNIFWQVAGAVTLGTNSHFEGILLAKTNIAILTGASANARMLAQTAVTLQSNAITQP